MHCIRSFITVLKNTHTKVVYQPVLKTRQIVKIPISYISNREEDETEKIIQEICEQNAELEKKLRILMLEVEVMRQDGRRAPNQMQSRNWKHLLELNSKNQRAQYLLYLFKTEKSKENRKADKEARRLEYETSKPEVIKQYPDDLIYGISHQTLFLRIRDGSVNQFDNYKALQAMLYGQNIVLDCSYEDKMVNREILNTAKQLTYVFGDNRIHKDPFNIHLCNLNMNGTLMDQLRRNIPNIDEPWFPLNLHSESYLDIFPKEKLVYLTPHCKEELSEFDPVDSIYIVGCMVDKINNEPLSLAKGKRDKVKMAKLPLDRYLEWAPGSKKNLNINHMVPILLDLKTTGDWEFSLRHIPRRKLMETKILAMQNQIKNKNLRQDVIKRFQNIPQFRKELRNSKRMKSPSLKSLFQDDDHL